jgi:hypothetical protein
VTTVITKPGLYPDIPEDEYHADPVPDGSLSVSAAKKLLPPDCPAIFDWERKHPKPPTKSMELGTVVHGLVLGTGQPVAVVDADNWRGNEAKESKAKAIAAGEVPMLAKDYAEAKAIAAAVTEDDDAGPLFDSGDAEQSMFWQDSEFGIWLRSRMDWLTWFDGIPTIVDLKSSKDSSPKSFAKSADDFRYFMQDPHYRDGLAAILRCDPAEIDFVFCVVPVEPPYLVMTYRLEPEDVTLGREQNRIAREKYRDCTAAGIWPKWSNDITPLALPPYARRRIESEINEYYD